MLQAVTQRSPHPCCFANLVVRHCGLCGVYRVVPPNPLRIVPLQVQGEYERLLEQYNALQEQLQHMLQERRAAAAQAAAAAVLAEAGVADGGLFMSPGTPTGIQLSVFALFAHMGAWTWAPLNESMES